MSFRHRLCVKSVPAGLTRTLWGLLRTELPPPPHKHIFSLYFACRKKLVKNKFNQRSERKQKERQRVKPDKIIA